LPSESLFNKDVLYPSPYEDRALVAFLILLVYGETSDPTEIAFSVGAFAVSWAVISYSVKNLGSGSTSKKDLEKEFQWFAGILVIFLVIVTLIGTTDDTVNLSSSTYTIMVFGLDYS
jgi:tellurite resistance protein TehA-like permease